MCSDWAKKLSMISVIVVVLAGVFGWSGETAVAQSGITPLRVEEAVTGQLTTAEPTAIYSFNAAESLRMAVVFDVTAGDMQVSVVVLDQDQKTLLAGSTGPNSNGLVVKFPKAGEYYLGVQGDSGTSATYRLMVNAAPALPINEFVMLSYPVAGTATTCAENTPTALFTTTEDLNVCFALALISDPVKVKIEWWSPSGDVALDQDITADTSYNDELILTGLVYKDKAWETGWWQVHFLINGELSHIQWVVVQ